jgi:hypothetical protein
MPEPVLITNEATRQVEVTPLATVEKSRVATVEVTRLIVITATLSDPTETQKTIITPTLRTSPLITVNPTMTDKTEGSYLVGTEIAPGIWRSKGGSSDRKCYLEITDYGGNIVAITGELPGATIRIPVGKYKVFIGSASDNKCTWYFVRP